MTGRILGSALFGALVGAWLARALFKWILDVGTPWVWIAIGACAIAGAALCALGAAEDARAKR